MSKDKSVDKTAEKATNTEPLVINTKNNKTNREMSITVDFPKTIEGLVDEFGKEVVHSLFRRQYKIDAQGKLRNLMGADQEGKLNHESEDEIKSIFAEWKPGIKQEKRPSVDKVLSQASKLSEEELEKMLAKLRASK